MGCLPLVGAFAVATVGCAPTRQPARRASSPPEQTASTEMVTAEPQLPLRASELLAQLEPTKERSRSVSVGQTCGNGESPLPLESTGAFDRRHARWVVVDVEKDLGEPARIVWAGFVPASPSSAGPAPATRAIDSTSSHSFCRTIAANADLIDTPNLVEANALEHFALGAASSLVRFDSWLLYADTSTGTDDALHIFRANGRDHAVVARKTAMVGALDEAACRAERYSEITCTEMRAWLSIMAVRRAPDGSSLLVQGHAGPADHARSGAFHWVVPLARPSSNTITTEP